MAARFGATIVPFAAVGVDDSLNILADSQQLEAMPVVGDMLRRRAGGLPQVRPRRTPGPRGACTGGIARLERGHGGGGALNLLPASCWRSFQP